jgi:hypothetical protein
MNFKTVFNREQIVDLKFHNSQIIELNQGSSIQAKVDQTNRLEGGITLIIAFTTFLILLFWIKKRAGKTVRVQSEYSKNQSSEIPCYKCKFFQDNPYLKCAIQPSIVLTKEALDCSEHQAP